MTLRVVGAGLGRTGTSSLRVALEQLLSGRCYHMTVVSRRPRDIAVWRQRLEHGDAPDWREFFADYVASLDWPAAAYWTEIAAAHPNAFVLLSTRASADDWYASFERTILPLYLDAARYPQPAIRLGCDVTAATLTSHLDDAAAAKEAYEQHNAEVRRRIAPERLIEWQPGDGWRPLCAALGVPEPAEPFPHVNASDEFRDIFSLDAATATLRGPRSVGGVRRSFRRLARAVRARVFSS